MEPTSLILSIVSVANMGILGVLVAIFGNMYQKTRAQLPLGMIVVAIMLILHNVIGAIGYFSHERYFHMISSPTCLVSELPNLQVC